MHSIDFIIEFYNLIYIDNIDESSIDADIKSKIPYVSFKLKRTIDCCPYCDSKTIKIASSRVEKIRHSTRDGYACTVFFDKRVYFCENCYKYFCEKLDNFSNNHGISFALKAEALNKLKDKKKTYLEVAKELNISVTTVQNIFDESVNIKRHKMPKVLSIDEIYSKELTEYKYCCVLYGPLTSEVIDVIDSRRKNRLQDYLRRIKCTERDNVEFITIDLNKTYRSLAYNFFKKAKICADPFHVIKNLNVCFDKVRLRVMKTYEDSKERNGFDYWLIKKYYKFLLADFEKIKDVEYYFKKKDCYVSKYYILDELLKLDPDLKEAYYLKESYRDFNKYCTLENAEERLKELMYDFRNTNVKEMEPFAYLLSHWKNEIVNSFNIIDGWRLTNSNIERINEDIGLLFSCSYGLTNFKRARNRIMYSLNKNEPIDFIK